MKHHTPKSSYKRVKVLEEYDGQFECPDCGEILPPWDFPRLTDMKPMEVPSCSYCLEIKLKDMIEWQENEELKEEEDMKEESIRCDVEGEIGEDYVLGIDFSKSPRKHWLWRLFNKLK